MYPFVFVSTVGSYKIGCPKYSIIIIIKNKSNPTLSVQVRSSGTRAAPGGKGGNEETAALKREIRELNARIKQLEMEARRAGPGVGAVAVAADGGASEVRGNEESEMMSDVVTMIVIVKAIVKVFCISTCKAFK